jgi:outer membrane lipoprotein carrier protein
MKIIYIVIIACILSSEAFGQNDPQAVKILDSFSSKSLSAPSVSMDFRMVRNNLAESTADTSSGSIILCRDKYRLSFADNIIWFNGETTWNYLVAEKEVTITRADKKDHSFQNRPSGIFTMYKSGYKSKLIEERSDVCIIDLYPEDLKSDMVRVRLSIGKPGLSLRSLEYKRKDGLVISLEISGYNLQTIPDPSAFNFQKEKYKGIEIIDMR